MGNVSKYSQNNTTISKMEPPLKLKTQVKGDWHATSMLAQELHYWHNIELDFIRSRSNNVIGLNQMVFCQAGPKSKPTKSVCLMAQDTSGVVWIGSLRVELGLLVRKNLADRDPLKLILPRHDPTHVELE